MTTASPPPERPGARLRRLLSAGDGPIVAPGVYDGITAHLARRMGFRAAYLTGAGVAAAAFGLPDIGLVGMAEMAERATMTATVLGDIPLIADADTGYGPAPSIARTVRAYERAGVAAIQLEDQEFPKRCGHLPDKRVVRLDVALGRLHAALDTRTDALVVARTDALAVLGVAAAIDRGNAFAEAGADLVFVEAPRTVAEIVRIGREIRAPKLVNIVAGGLTPDLDPATLRDLGYVVAIYPTTALLAATAAARSAYRGLGGHDGGLSTDTMPDFFRLVGLTEWTAVADAWPTTTPDT